MLLTEPASSVVPFPSLNSILLYGYMCPIMKKSWFCFLVSLFGWFETGSHEFPDMNSLCDWGDLELLIPLAPSQMIPNAGITGVYDSTRLGSHHIHSILLAGSSTSDGA